VALTAQDLPQGSWITFINLPPDTTASDLSAFFETVFPFDIPPTHILVEAMHSGAKARVVVSISREQVRYLLHWILEGHTFKDFTFRNNLLVVDGKVAA